ncbi:MAG: protein kinase [Actinomycetota bacterium]
MAADLGISGLADIQEIGAGGNGVVYRARQVDLDRLVAVKMVHLANNPETIERFNRECRTMARIAIHPGVAPIFESGTTSTGKPYLIMPFYEAGSLAERMTKGAVPWAEASRIMVAVADAIEHAHDIDVIHRDLKPDNIMIDGRGEPVVVDFGIAKLVGSESQTVGIHLTPSYAPPEAFEGRLPDRRYDVYSLGATLHALIGGRLPFDTEGGILAVGMQKSSKPPPDLRAYAPDAVCRVIEQAMAIDPNQRYQTAEEFGAALAAAAGVDAPKKATTAGGTPVDDALATQVAPVPPANMPPPGQGPTPTPPPHQQPSGGFPTPTPPPQQQPAAQSGGFQAPTPPPHQQPGGFQAPTPPPHQQPGGFQAPTPPPHQQPSSGFQAPTPPPYQQPSSGFQAPTAPPHQQPSSGFQAPTPPPQPFGFQPAGQTTPGTPSGQYGFNAVADTATQPPSQKKSSSTTLLVVLAAVAVLILGTAMAIVAFGGGDDEAGGDEPEPEPNSFTDTTPDEEPGPTTESSAVEPEPEPDDGSAIPDDRSSGEATAKDLEVGDCFLLPDTAGIFDTVELTACTTAHDAEVTAILEHPEAGQAYPGVDALIDYTTFPCADGFQQYVGIDDEFLTEFESGSLYPTFDEWDAGVFVIPCVAQRWDGEQVSSSIRDRGNDADVYLDYGDLNGLDRLYVGDCLNEDAGLLETRPLRQVISLANCDEVNSGEVVGFIDLVGPADGNYDFQTLLDEGFQTCSPLYTEYTDLDVADGSGLNAVVPSASEWAAGARLGVCVVLKVEGGEVGSIAAG